MTCFAKLTKALAIVTAATTSFAAEAPFEGVPYTADTAGDENGTDDADGMAIVEEILGTLGFKVYPSDLGGVDTWLKLTLVSIDEIDVNGNQVDGHFVDTANVSDDLELSEFTTNDVANATAHIHSWTLRLPNMTACGSRSLAEAADPSVSFVMIVFNDTISADYGGSTIVVRKGDLKFNLGSDNWPLCADTNKLVMRVKVESKGNGAVKSFLADPTPQRNSGKLLHIGAGAADVMVELPTVAIVDDVYPRNFDLEMSNADSTMSFKFPHFTNKLVYDAVISFVDPEKTTQSDGRAPANGAGAASPFAAAMLVAVVPLLAALLG